VSSNHFHAFILAQIVRLGRGFESASVSQSSSTSVLLVSERASMLRSALYRRSSFIVVLSPSCETSCVDLKGGNADIDFQVPCRILLVYREMKGKKFGWGDHVA
jgi:hypothetical protein